MLGHVLVFGVVVTIGLLLPQLRADAQSLLVYGADPNARECFDSATSAAAGFGSTSLSARMSCTTALESGRLSIKDKAATHVNRGILSMALEEYGSALGDFDAATKLYPDYGAIYLNRGNVFFIRESYDSAIAEYTKALAAEMNEYQVAYLNRGMAHENLGHWEAAAADYREALALDPQWGLAMSKLARVSEKRN